MKTFLVQVMLPASGLATKTIQAEKFAWLATTVRFYDEAFNTIAEFNSSNTLCVWEKDCEVKDD